MTEQEKRREIFKRSFGALCDYGHYPHYFDYSAEDTNIFVRLYMEYDEVDPQIAILVPRSKHMKPYYPALRKWFDYHGLAWKDRSRDKQRYMFAYVVKNAANLENLIRNIGTMVFGVEELELKPRGASIVYWRMAITAHPYKSIALMIFGAFNLLALAIYELFHLASVNFPSFTNVNVVEIWLFGLYAISYFLTMLLQIRPSIHIRKKKPFKLTLIAEFIFYGSVALMFCTS